MARKLACPVRFPIGTVLQPSIAAAAAGRLLVYGAAAYILEREGHLLLLLQQLYARVVVVVGSHAPITPIDKEVMSARSHHHHHQDQELLRREKTSKATKGELHDWPPPIQNRIWPNQKLSGDVVPNVTCHRCRRCRRILLLARDRFRSLKTTQSSGFFHEVVT